MKGEEESQEGTGRDKVKIQGIAEGEEESQEETGRDKVRIQGIAERSSSPAAARS